ncbi:MAG TPA: hypothetical protein VFY65_20890 [Longimicrobium sp.]|nr:hypothetical protein [Longimicrobium sp.]
MRPNFFARSFAAVAAALALAACEGGGTIDTDPLSDTYVLTSLNGATDPMVLAEYTYPSGTRQLWLMVYDSVTISSDTEGRRSYEMVMLTYAHDNVSVAPVTTPVSKSARITRRGERLIFEYDQSSSRIKADTMVLVDGKLIKQGPYGVSCTDCVAPAKVEYVYEPR